jgi:hypothetical protein
MQARHAKTATTAKTDKSSRMASVKVGVYSNSLEGVSVANGHAKPLQQEPRTVILSEQQVELLQNNAGPTAGLVTVPVTKELTKDKVFECAEESLFYSQCIEGMVFRR